MYEQITCLCWNSNSIEIYVGDAVGRVSIMVLSIFTVNGMFQAPTCTLMNLDSSIVQLSFFPPLLLVSTLSRCYICNTVQEQYKQIGNKPRNGEFGACFYKVHANENAALDTQREERNLNKTRGAFNLVSDNDRNILDSHHSKIFCCRPGSRLWEVSADGIVVKTHQFKEALAVPPTALFRSNSTLGSSQQGETECDWPPQSVNFSHLFVIAYKYLFSYTTSGLYIIDPANASVLLWSNEYANVSMTAVVDDRIYLMTCDNEFHCLTLTSLDSLILRLYRREQYSECLTACFVYKSHLSKIVTQDAKEIVELLEAKSLPEILQDEEALTLLRSLITLLQAAGSNRPAKLDSGIVVVHSENSDSLAENSRRAYGCELTPASRSSDIFNEDSSEIEILEPGRDADGNIAEGNAPEAAADDVRDERVDSRRKDEVLGAKDNTPKSDPQENITHMVQSDLQPIYALANSVRSSMSEKEVEEVASEMERRMRTIRESYCDMPGLQSFIYEITRAAELHYYNAFLENVSMQLLYSTGNDYIVRQFAKAFVEINASGSGRCSCGYPYPLDEEAAEPKFLAVGEALIKRHVEDLPEECGNICDQVPYMWREYVSVRVARRSALDNLLRQCLQTRDNVTLSLLLPALNEQQWACVSACLNEMEDGTCLFCAMPLVKKPDYKLLMDWSGIAREIMKREGPDEAVAFLIKLESVIPDVNLDRSIFQSIIFTKMLHRRGLKKSIDFSKINQLTSEFGTMCSPQVRDQLAKTLEHDLRRSIDKNVFGTGAHHWGMRYQAKSLTCPCCTLSLETPILLGNSGIAIFRCGHAYHVNCMIERKLTKCNLHQ
ncbi:Hermansky-Pudlak syndrome 5 protein-like protein [Ooceraea biroi]|nr:Hermansky-Pudlak syndrome 5 protein-like protein [Ooceraea biroi]